MWSSIITVALLIAQRMLIKANASDGLMKKFYQFSRWFDKHGALKSVELRESYLEQLKKLEAASEGK